MNKPATSSLATASLITGIPGLCCFPAGIVAIVLGVVALKNISDSDKTGKLHAIAGITCGCLSMLFLLIALLIPETPPTPEELAAKAEQKAKQAERQKEREAQKAKERAEAEAARKEREAQAAKTSKQVEAWTAAQHFVQQKLKSPSTASWGGFSEYQDPRKCATKFGDDGTYIVTGFVDAQNEFGATVRQDFSVKIQEQGEKWVLTGEVLFYPR